MKNAARCVTREKVITLLNGMFQIKKEEQNEAASVVAFLHTKASLEMSPLRATVAQVTSHLRSSQHCWLGLESPGIELCAFL